MARKVVAQQPQRRAGVNRAQLKALAARQAMTNTATTTPRPRPVEGDEAAADAPVQFDYTSVLPRSQRRAFLTREQEYAYIRGDLIRLMAIAGLALAILVVLLFVLR